MFPSFAVRRASSLVRTLIVASSTLAILLVCFSMYQYSQSGDLASQQARPPRLPSTPTEPAPPLPVDRANPVAGVPVGQGIIGAGREANITIYPREGTRAQMELSVRDWVPKDGSDHEFLLTNPEVRMRTKDGNPVRVTAREGVMEAHRKSGGGLDLKRGQLSGGVLIEFDRRSDKDLAASPEAQRDQPSPDDLVLVEADELEFDLQYSRVSVPGAIRVLARDVQLQTADLEVRFNEAEGRVESLRSGRGGRLELSDPQGQYAFSVPGVDRAKDRRATIVSWIQATIQARLQTQAAPQPPPKPEVVAEATESDVPVFRTREEKVERVAPPVHYFARFDGEVDARHMVDQATRSRLQADVLEILRDFSDSDKERVRSSPAPAGGAAPEQAVLPPPPAERMVLEWTGRLAVEALSPGDARLADSVRSRVTATGSPAHLLSPEGQADCSQLIYEPDRALVRLDGTISAPVEVRSDQGTMTGTSASLRRDGDRLEIEIAGPGKLVDSLAGTKPGPDGAPPPLATPSTIEFSQKLEARGRFVTRTSVDFTGTISSREHRVLDRAVFTGRVKVEEGETSLEADHLDATFTEQAGGRGDGASIRKLTGEGNVVMMQGADRVTCHEIEVEFTTDAAGRSVPSSATARRDVVAHQGDRVLSAEDSLIVDFAPVVAAAEAEKRSAARSVAQRLRASGRVTIHDPAQLLDVAADEIDCGLANGREIEKAVLIGSEQRPATVRLDALTVTGATVHLQVPDQWAEVPGAGRLTFLSRKDLNGERLSSPMPVAVTWSESMRFRGRENRAVFLGAVHAASESTTTFDCDELLIDFEDVAPPGKTVARGQWGILQPFVDRATGTAERREGLLGTERFSKEPVYLLADGHAVAEMSEMDESGGEMASRSRISGPRLSVNLRSPESKMLIEGLGNLQLEDFRPPPSQGQSLAGMPTQSPPSGRAVSRSSDLFGVDKDTGPSKTLIEWRERMWYDFSMAQTRFEGEVRLKHFSGAELEKLFEMASSSNMPAGRSTFLSCDVLTVDFAERDARARDGSGRPRGRLSSDHLRQFHASGGVVLQDQVEGLSVTADTVVFEKPRQLLAISGTKQRKATIITQKPGKLPNQVATERLFYNFATGKLELVQTTVKGQ